MSSSSSSLSLPTTSCYWLATAADDFTGGSATTIATNPPTAICFGTGRFLRCVLVPLLHSAASGAATTTAPPVLIQTRGTSFIEYMKRRSEAGASGTGTGNNTYEVDTVLSSGQVQTETIACSAVFSMGHDKESIYSVLFPALSKDGIRMIGVGVTEGGMASPDTPAMRDLYELFVHMRRNNMMTMVHSNKICVVNTDNVPNNGDVLASHMRSLAVAANTCTGKNNSPDNDMLQFFETHVAFLNSMVDRITSHREGDPNVPRAEPVPAKALVILDEHGDLPLEFVAQSQNKNSGLVIRRTRRELQADIALKLRVANATHTALAHLMALCRQTQTDALSLSLVPSSASSSENDTLFAADIVLDYLDALFYGQILPGATVVVGTGTDANVMADPAAVEAVWHDWRGRLTHPHFGLSTFFITQNGAAKGGIRLGPTVVDLILASSSSSPSLGAAADDDTGATTTTTRTPAVSVAMAFCFAVLLRWLTPLNEVATADGVYTGWLNGSSREQVALAAAAKKKDSSATASVEYADGLRYDLDAGWYEFRCACDVVVAGSSAAAAAATVKSVSAWLGSYHQTPQQASAYVPAIRAYLTAPTGGDLGRVEGTRQFETFVQGVATLYARMIAGDDLLGLLKEMKDGGLFTADAAVMVDSDPAALQPNGRPLHYRPSPIPDNSALMRVPVTEDSAASVVMAEVASAQVIDIHTHLLPPSHGSLCLWGIDELLTYHYLVAEYFMTAPGNETPEMFYDKTKQDQANLIWKALFVDRTPMSEATRGVVTTLVAFGLFNEVHSRDLESIRKFYSEFRNDGLAGAERFSDMVHTRSGVRYNIMTNIPFDTNEAQHWRPKRKAYPEHYRSALRVDPLLSGDRKTVEIALLSSGYDSTIEGARKYLRDWCDTMKPEYMMASTPHDFVLMEDKRAALRKHTGINKEAMKQPGAFADAIGGGSSACDGTDEDVPSAIDEQSDLLSEVLMKVCEELDLPVALKIGAHRGVNPRLKQAGDGIVAFADASMLGRLCARFPNVRFLATFLSRTNQHEACVLASKFGNLHIYGCWWYCFTPSIVKEITQMRIEMLGTAFTAQHSDARVLDQLIYKWSHSRAVIGEVLTKEFVKLCASGWKPTRAELRRDVAKLFGGSYEEFMVKSLS